jgi:predicted aspartyl protease
MSASEYLYGRGFKEAGEKPDERAQSSKQFVLKNHREKRAARVGIESGNNDPGYYVRASIHGTSVKMLVDTGATVSLISKEVYEKISSHADELRIPKRNTFC